MCHRVNCHRLERAATGSGAARFWQRPAFVYLAALRIGSDGSGVFLQAERARPLRWPGLRQQLAEDHDRDGSVIGHSMHASEDDYSRVRRRMPCLEPSLPVSAGLEPVAAGQPDTLVSVSDIAKLTRGSNGALRSGAIDRQPKVSRQTRCVT